MSPRAGVLVRRSFKFLLRPTRHQEVALTACLDDHRTLYNAALEHRRTAYRTAGVNIRYGEQPADLKHIRAEDPDGQGQWSFSSQQATLRRLDTAFAAFFARLQAGRTPGYPRFKGRGRFDTVTWPKDGDGCRWDSQPEHPSVTFVRLQGVGHVRVHRHLPPAGTARRRTASPKPGSTVSGALIRRTPTSTRRSTSCGQGLPFATLRKRPSEKPLPSGNGGVTPVSCHPAIKGTSRD